MILMSDVLNIISVDFFSEIIELITKILPVLIIAFLFNFAFTIIEYSQGSLNESDTEREIIKDDTLKITHVSQSRDIPFRCPYCWGMSNDSSVCQYCGSRLE